MTTKKLLGIPVDYPNLSTVVQVARNFLFKFVLWNVNS
jgi:hypothetical protein